MVESEPYISLLPGVNHLNSYPWYIFSSKSLVVTVQHGELLVAVKRPDRAVAEDGWVLGH